MEIFVECVLLFYFVFCIFFFFVAFFWLMIHNRKRVTNSKPLFVAAIIVNVRLVRGGGEVEAPRYTCGSKYFPYRPSNRFSIACFHADNDCEESARRRRKKARRGRKTSNEVRLGWVERLAPFENDRFFRWSIAIDLSILTLPMAYVDSDAEFIETFAR